MQDFQQRVVNERNELEGNINRLSAFGDTAMFTGLPEIDRTLLVLQLGVMRTYRDILSSRIARF